MSDVAHDPAALDLTWDDSHAGALALLPTGPVWPRDREGTLARTVRGLVGVHWRAWTRVRDLLNEADPRTCYETIRMWEIDCGLPDPCVDPPPTSLEGRRAAILARRHEGGTTTPMDFVALATELGYDIEIIEFRPFRSYSPCNAFLNPDWVWPGPGRPTVPPYPPPPASQSPGDYGYVRVAWAHCWMVNVINADRAIRVMTSTSPCTAFLREWVTGDLECLFERIKPAQSHIIWAYSGAPP